MVPSARSVRRKAWLSRGYDVAVKLARPHHRHKASYCLQCRLRRVGVSGSLPPSQARLLTSWSDRGCCDGVLPRRAGLLSSRQRGPWSSERLPRAASYGGPWFHELPSCDRGVPFGLWPFGPVLPWPSCAAARDASERGSEFSTRQPRSTRSRPPVLGFSLGGGRRS